MRKIIAVFGRFLVNPDLQAPAANSFHALDQEDGREAAARYFVGDVLFGLRHAHGGQFLSQVAVADTSTPPDEGRRKSGAFAT
jgi:hypothetical protein